jgi:hypothetical protein
LPVVSVLPTVEPPDQSLAPFLPSTVFVAPIQLPFAQAISVSGQVLLLYQIGQRSKADLYLAVLIYCEVLRFLFLFLAAALVCFPVLVLEVAFLIVQVPLVDQQLVLGFLHS